MVEWENQSLDFRAILWGYFQLFIRTCGLLSVPTKFSGKLVFLFCVLAAVTTKFPLFGQLKDYSIIFYPIHYGIYMHIDTDV